MELAWRIKVPLALCTHVEFVKMFVELVAIKFPVPSVSVTASFAHRAAIFLPTMFEQVVPSSAVVVAFWTLVVVRRVAFVLNECAE